MRTAFVETLCELAEQDPRVFLLTADLGWSVLERFAQRFPDRFLNVGVAEQNMMGVATGLAMVGFVPYAYSIATFSSMRCYEQTRDGPVLHRLPVRVIGTGGGFAYGHAGPTHHALEDLVLARSQPGMIAVAPADPAQARAALRATHDLPGPVYLRIGKAAGAAIPNLDGRFALGRPELVRAGEDLLLVAVGEIVQEALGAAEILAHQGIRAAVAVMAHLPYAPSGELCRLLGQYRRVVAVEEGFTAGGLGSLLAEAIACGGLDCRLTVRGVEGTFLKTSGSTAFFRARWGLDAETLAAAVAAPTVGAPA